MSKKNLKPLPQFKSEDEEHKFWATHEIVDYIDTSKRVKLDLSSLKPSTKTVTLRMSESMIYALKTIANKNDVPYQSLIKLRLAEMIREEQMRWK